MELPSQDIFNAIERGMSAHYERVMAYYRASPAFDEMEYYLEKLMKPDFLEFTIGTINEKIKQLRHEGFKHLHGSKSFSDTYLTVSIIPAINPTEAAGYFDKGYLDFFSGLVQESGWGAGGVNVANWIACLSENGQLMYHFSYYPMKPEDEDNFYPLLAQDLLTETEKQQIGMV